MNVIVPSPANSIRVLELGYRRTCAMSSTTGLSAGPTSRSSHGSRGASTGPPDRPDLARARARRGDLGLTLAAPHVRPHTRSRRPRALHHGLADTALFVPP